MFEIVKAPALMGSGHNTQLPSTLPTPNPTSLRSLSNSSSAYSSSFSLLPNSNSTTHSSMASTSTLTLFALFITVSILPSFTFSDNFLAPLLSPLMGDICKTVGCGKGECKISENNDIDFPNYECECDPGWKQLFSFNSNASDFKFLPCVIPNCTLDFACSEAAPPAQSKETTANASIFEPCHWANCGGGVCNKTSGLAYTCECKEGYYNLFNNTAFPCFKECSIGGDCSNLGITMTNKSTAPPPNLPDKSANQACSLQHKALYVMIMLVTASAAVL